MSHSHQAPDEISVDSDVTVIQVIHISWSFQERNQNDISCLHGKAKGLSSQSDSVLANSSAGHILIIFKVVVPFLPIEQSQVAE